ncbi:MAG: oligoendopeptidase F family protein, partial [Clostridia bacterium]|nr:oligoendopeptidase F family protein [Clostridia bacterium]
MRVLSRERVDSRYKWRLEDIIPSDEEWESQYSSCEELGKEVGKYQGKLNDKDSILKCLRFDDKLSIILEKLYVYAKMRKDEDCSVNKYVGMVDRIKNLLVGISEKSAYITPELSANSEEFLQELAKDKDFEDYSYMLELIVKNKKHTLSTPEEVLLAKTGLFSGIFQEAFGMFDNLDVKFAPFTTSSGEKVELSHGLYGALMQSPERKDRQKAFYSMFNAYKDMINTIATIYIGNVKKNVFYSQVRKYENCLDRATSGEDVSIDVYYRLLDCINDNIPLLHRYLRYRRRALGYKTLQMYDLHVPITGGDSLGVEYEEACKIVKEALKPLGEEYAGLLEKAFNEGWIDVYENKGKRSGAYSWGCYGTHPYVLLNYQKTTHDVFTIAHELGHAMHTYYS